MSTAAVVVITYTIACSERIAGNVSGYGAGAKLVNKVLVLRRLRSAEPEVSVLALELIDLGLHKEVHYLAGIAVLIVDNVPGVVVYVVVEVAEVGGHVVVYAVNPALDAAAAGGKLCAQSIKAGLGLEAEGANGVVDIAEIAVKCAVEGSKGIGEAIGLLVKLAYESLLIHGVPHVCLGSAAAIIAAISAETAAETTATPSEYHGKEYQAKPAIAKATKAAVSTARVLSCEKASCKSIIHIFISFHV